MNTCPLRAPLLKKTTEDQKKKKKSYQNWGGQVVIIADIREGNSKELSWLCRWWSWALLILASAGPPPKGPVFDKIPLNCFLV